MAHSRLQTTDEDIETLKMGIEGYGEKLVHRNMGIFIDLNLRSGLTLLR